MSDEYQELKVVDHTKVVMKVVSKTGETIKSVANYRVEGGKYIEEVGYGANQGVHSFDCTVTGNRWHHKGSVGGYTVNETWEKISP